MKKITISVIIITFNEERCIKRCLNSIKKMADEIIVVDSCSTDRTKEIVLSMNMKTLKFYDYQWEKGFSKARNFGLKKATKEWVLYIDADEYLEEKSIESFNKEMEILNKEILKDSFKLCPNIINHDGSVAFDVPRMFFRKGNIKWYGKIHEEIRCYEKALISKVIPIYLKHDGYMPEIIKEKNKTERNIKLLEEMVKIEPDNLRWQYFLVRDSLGYWSNEKSINYLNDLIGKIEKFNMSKEDKERRVFKLCTYLASLTLSKEDFDVKILDKMNTIKPNNSNSIYFKHLRELIKIRASLSNIINELNEEIPKQMKDDSCMIHSKHEHLYFLQYVCLSLVGNNTYFKQYLNNNKDKYVDTYILKLFGIELN